MHADHAAVERVREKAKVAAKPYELGMNCAGETAGQVANYILADLRVYLRGQPLGTQLLDDMGERIYHAIREATGHGIEVHRKAFAAAMLAAAPSAPPPASKEHP